YKPLHNNDIKNHSLHDALPIYNNNISNLEWCSLSDNIKHAYMIGLRCNKGINSPTSKLNENDVREIRELSKKKSVNEISEMYGRSEQHTSELQSRFDIVCRLLL